MPSYYISLPLDTHPVSADISYETQKDPQGAHWTSPSSHHITLVHFGQGSSLTHTQQIDVEVITKLVLARHSEISFSLSSTPDFGNGCFGKLMVNSNGAIELLQAALLNELKLKGFSRYTLSALPPHMTVIKQPGAFGKQIPFTKYEQEKLRSIAVTLGDKPYSAPISRVLFRVNRTDIAAFSLKPLPKPIPVTLVHPPAPVLHHFAVSSVEAYVPERKVADERKRVDEFTRVVGASGIPGSHAYGFEFRDLAALTDGKSLASSGYDDGTLIHIAQLLVALKSDPRDMRTNVLLKSLVDADSVAWFFGPHAPTDVSPRFLSFLKPLNDQFQFEKTYYPPASQGTGFKPTNIEPRNS